MSSLSLFKFVIEELIDDKFATKSVILDLVNVLLGIVNVEVFTLDTFILVDKLIELFKTDILFVPVNVEEIVQELFKLLIEIPVPPTRVILSCLLLDKFETDVFNEPILFERLSNEVLRCVILFFVIVLSGIVIVEVFKFVTIILVDKLIVSFTLLITKLLSVLLY